METRRMRSGLTGRLIATGGKDHVAVMYSLDGQATRGRLRPIDPDTRFPRWVEQGAYGKLYAYDSVPIDIEITLVKHPREGWKNDDHFAEFIVRLVRH